MMVARRCVVRGRVQGVAFRWSTRERALALGVCGSVRNLADGSVEVLIQGESTQVDRLCDWLWQGPPHARVESVRCHEMSVDERREFEIV